MAAFTFYSGSNQGVVKYMVFCKSLVLMIDTHLHITCSIMRSWLSSKLYNVHVGTSNVRSLDMHIGTGKERLRKVVLVLCFTTPQAGPSLALLHAT